MAVLQPDDTDKQYHLNHKNDFRIKIFTTNKKAVPVSVIGLYILKSRDFLGRWKRSYRITGKGIMHGTKLKI